MAKIGEIKVLGKRRCPVAWASGTPWGCGSLRPTVCKEVDRSDCGCLSSLSFLWCKPIRPLVKPEMRIINRVLIFLLVFVFGY